MTAKMIVLADLGRVKAYRVTHDMMTSKAQVEMVYDCEFLEAHRRVVDRVTDSAGRYAAAGNSGGSTSEAHGMADETERRQIRTVAEKINELVEGEKYWYLAAPENINGRLIVYLRPSARASLVRNLPADLVKVRKQELLDHFLAPVG
jgi:hypothetical protein